MAVDPISWETAQRVAARISGNEPFSSSYLAASFEADMIELTSQAESLVEQETGLVANGPARVRVADRVAWASANIASFRRLLKPLTERLGSKIEPGAFSSLSRKATGAQLGVVLGWMSTRVLGQYDLLLLEDQMPEDQDIVYYVGPNILGMEKRFAFPPREFRLWIALHECTHRAQFTGVPWLTEYFRKQVESLLATVDVDSRQMSDAVKTLKDEVKAGNNPLKDGGILTLLTTPEQQDSLQKILGLMALLEGHGDVTMSRAGNDLIPSSERFHRVLQARRAKKTPMAVIMNKVLGMDAKMRQYAEGEKFIETVEASGGRDLMNQVWKGPEDLPTYDEIKEPQKWIKRHTGPERPVVVGNKSGNAGVESAS